MRAIIVKNVCKSFGNANILNSVNLEVNIGEIFGLIGPNGAGKTTLIKCMLRLIHPNEGKVYFYNKPFDSMEIKKIIGYVPERPVFYKDMTGNEFLSYMGKLSGIEKNILKTLIKTIMEEVGLENSANKKIALYSRGMQQRLMIAQALIHDPQLLILDEPTAGLDPYGILFLREKLFSFKKEGKTVLISSNQISEVEKICDRIAFIDNGAIKMIQTLNLEDFFLIECENIDSNFKFQEANKSIGIDILSIKGGKIELRVKSNKQLIEFLNFISEKGVIVKQVLNKKGIESIFEK